MTTKESSLVQEKLLQPWIGLSPVKQPFIEMSKFVKKPVSTYQFKTNFCRACILLNLINLLLDLHFLLFVILILKFDRN